MDTTQTKNAPGAVHSPYEDDDHVAGVSKRDPSDPPIDFQPESGQPGPREAQSPERDEDDDL